MTTAPGGPLAGVTVVVTRARESAGTLVDPLAALGAAVISCPAIRVEFADPGKLRNELSALDPADWIVFTSGNAVKSLAPVLEGSLREAKIAAIGGATAAAVKRAGLTPGFRPRTSTSEALREELESVLRPGERVLLPQSDLADRALAEALERRGVSVAALTTYRTRSEGHEAGAALLAFLGERIPAAVLFASPSAVRGLGDVLGRDAYRRVMEGAALVSIGPATSRQISALGFRVAREAEPHSAAGLVEAVRSLFERR
jgi:uroporphyrinogen-III synthase